MEKETGASRRVNLDPGTIDGARLLLASTKGQAHRVYLRDGIFCEVTLCRRKGRWENFFYTFLTSRAAPMINGWNLCARTGREVRCAPAAASGGED
ncbi:MAG: DUF4416 family protein [Cloacibacillus evryensis]